MSNVYLKYFGLGEPPFAITPDPSFVYLSPAHRDALAHLLHGVGQGGSGGFVQLTGEVGTGKTTMCRCLLEQLPEKTQVALILNPLVTPREMLATICEELGIETEGIANSSKALVDALNKYLLGKHADGWQVVVVIDEAQNLSPEALEQVRLLTNLETSKQKLLQMVLLGQPELRDLLQRTDLRQLAQRITARYHLASLDAEETAAYVRHRLQVAGAPRNPFSRAALKALHQRSGGVPRVINIIADRALAAAYAAEASGVTPRMIHAAANEVQPGERQVHSNRTPWLVAGASAALLLVITLAMNSGALLQKGSEAEPAASAVVQSALPPPSANESPAADSKPAGETGSVEHVLDGEATQAQPDEHEYVAEVQNQIDEGWLIQQHNLAWLGLAELWQDPARSDAIRAACAGDPGSGFACIREQGNWSRIRRLGLPVVLELQSDSGQPRHLLLSGMDDTDILVGSGADKRWVSRHVVEEAWLGDYVMAWPQAADWPAQIRLGELGQAVDIVMELARQAESPWTGESEFNEGFENWLKGFQRRHGLEADGIVGPVTLLYLMAPTISSPRLLDRPQFAAQRG